MGHFADTSEISLEVLLKGPKNASPLEEVVITEELQKRSSRAPDHKAEAETLANLAQLFSKNPENLFEDFTQEVLALLKSHSSGVSLLETTKEDGKSTELFRWKSVAGKMQHLKNSIMPRDFSPCAVVLKSESYQLFKYPVLHFNYLSEMDTPIYESLLVPFSQNGKIIGTVWAVANTPDRKFDLEDVRLLKSISGFAGAALQIATASKQVLFERHKLEKIFHDTPAGMSLWRGRDLIFEMVNPAYQADFPGRELMNRPLLEAIPELRDQPFEKLLLEVLETGKTFTAHEMPALIPVGEHGALETRYYDFTYVRIEDMDDKPYGVYEHCIDVTDRVLARKQIEENQVRLRLKKEKIETAVAVAKIGFSIGTSFTIKSQSVNR